MLPFLPLLKIEVLLSIVAENYFLDEVIGDLQIKGLLKEVGLLLATLLLDGYKLTVFCICI